MYRGEIYAYPLILQQNLLSAKNVTFFWQDVLCKYWPWLKNVDSQTADKMIPALSVMHAKGHAWYCEVVHGGRWVQGTALANGEEVEVEQVNSYLSRAAYTTKRMLPENRNEFLAECSRAWNSRKIDGMSNQLSQRYTRAKGSLQKLTEEVRLVCAENSLNVDVIDFNGWKEDIQNIATAESKRNDRDVLSPDEEYCIDVADLFSSGQLPDVISLANEPSLLKLHWEVERSGKNKQKKSTISTKKDYVLKRFAQLNLSAPAHDDLLATACTNVRENLICTLQRDMENISLSVYQLSSNARRLSDSSKVYVNIVKKCRGDKEKLKEKVEVYNSVAVACHLPLVKCDDIINGHLNWCNPGMVAGPPMKVKRDVVEKMLLVRRTKEELDLLVREMRDHIRFFRDKVLPALHSKQKDTEKLIQELANADDHRDVASGFVEAEQQQSRTEYRWSMTNAHAAGGLLCIIKDGIHCANMQLKVAVNKYQSVLDNDKDFSASASAVDEIEHLESIEDTDDEEDYLFVEDYAELL